MKEFLIIGLLGVILSTSLFAQQQTKPNVIFIYADDMGYGEVQALNPTHSKIPTPNLNQLAAEGMVFTDAHTSSSVCTPSRYGLMTGRYNWRTRLQRGIVGGGSEPLIEADRMTLGSLFRGKGYSTSIVGKWHLDYHYELPSGTKKPSRQKMTETHFYAPAPIGTHIPDGPISRGFDEFYGFQQSADMSSIVQDDTIIKEIPFIETLPDLTKEVVRQIDDKAAAAKSGKPFFIYFAQNSPHSPVAPAPNWKGKGTLGEYSDFVAQTDGSVGEVMEALNRNGLSENTIVIFSSDNGTSQGREVDISYLESKNHFPSSKLRGYKADLWDGGHRVPFILRWPEKVKAHSQSNQLICLTDMMATFAEMLSEELPDEVGEDSFSFFNSWFGKAVNNPRESIVHHSVHGRFSIRKGDWKLLLAPGSGGRTAPFGIETIKLGLPQVQLYNMKEDLGEKNNLVAQYPEKITDLIALLESYVSKGRSTLGAIQKNEVEIDIWKNELNSTEPHPSYRKSKKN
ncbi:sulfatase family protein [Arenibacter echinorum]|uniref:Arylsulfatase A-like enzyme n=1 Tax=Arenibacter echinorum TaxID=440515 RepID=A0A327QTP9_9FLAO|nr:arylsulfatase [Arenibacter echinorum]RAJ07996.1 arylsulfatase A-like enzyme [Arenibacter echinorum]